MICTDSLNMLSDDIFSHFKSGHKKKLKVNKNLSSSNRAKGNAGSGLHEKNFETGLFKNLSKC